MSTNLFKYAASATIFASAAVVAHHGARAQTADEHFAAADTNGDGLLSKAELLAAHRSGQHGEHPGDWAHHPSREEMEALHARVSPDRLHAIAEAEFDAAAGPDGLLSHDEMAGFHARLHSAARRTQSAQ